MKQAVCNYCGAIYGNIVPKRCQVCRSGQPIDRRKPPVGLRPPATIDNKRKGTSDK